MKLEDLQPNAAVRRVIPDSVVSVQWFGSAALELTYKNPAGRVSSGTFFLPVPCGLTWRFSGNYDA
jgi:hypothetical protein